MEEIVLCIPDELQLEIEQLKRELNVNMSENELCRYLLRLGLDVAGRGESLTDAM